MNVFYKLERNGKLFCSLEKLVLSHRNKARDFRIHLSHMSYRLNDVAGAGFALCSDHGRALVDSSQRLAEVLRSAYERNLKITFINMINVVRRGENFALVDIIYLNRFENLRLSEMPDSALCHYGNRNGVLYALYHLRVAHSRHSARRAYVCGDSFKCHDRARTRRFGNLRLLGSRNVHYDSALEHLRELFVKFVSVFHCFYLRNCFLF